ncbi:hypothetical protein TNCV_3376741 [Trichonephila clavipes]|nr:hypothetical protein TNCV_3376741 [Trichonephila clavipes]
MNILPDGSRSYVECRHCPCTQLYPKYLCNCPSIVGGGCGSPVVMVSNHGRHVTSPSTVPLKTHLVGQRCTLNLSRAQTSSRGYGVVVRRGGSSSGVSLVT